MANTIPPLAEPSSLVSTTPVTRPSVIVASPNSRAWARPFWPGGGVDHQQHLGDPAGALGSDPAHLAQLVHQVGLGVQTAGGVAEHEIDRAGSGPLDGVEDDGARIAALVAAHEFGTAALGPGAELLDGRGAERVAGGHQHRAPESSLLGADLADGRRLADAVDPDEQPDVRARPAASSKCSERSAPDRRATISACSASSSCAGSVISFAFTLARKPAEQVIGHPHADVGAQQRLLQVVPRSPAVIPRDCGRRATRRRARRAPSTSDRGTLGAPLRRTTRSACIGERPHVVARRPACAGRRRASTASRRHTCCRAAPAPTVDAATTPRPTTSTTTTRTR